MRKLAAIMFTDISGYSALMSRDEKLAMSILEKNRMIHKNFIARHDGEYIKEIGDGTLAIFQSSYDAILCALEIRQACLKTKDLKLRIGLHTGDIIIDHKDVFGDGVNIASRIEAAGEPGEIYISGKVYDDIKSIAEIFAIFIGEKKLKNIDQPVKIYKIDAEATKYVKKTGHNISEFTFSVDQTFKKKFWHLHPLIWRVAALTAIPALLITLILVLLPGKNEESKKRIVVALFENRTNDPSLDVLGKMTSDWITQGLSRSKEIEVVPSTTVMHIYGGLQDAGTIINRDRFISALVKETGAGILVTGSYYLQQGMLQFSVEVKDGNTGKLIYAPDAISGDVNQPMVTIEKLSNEIIGGLAYHINISPIEDLSKPPNKDAYIAYLTGIDLFGHDYAAAIRQFIKSALSDSLFVPPKVYIAMAYANQEKYAQADSMVRNISKMRDRLTNTENHFLNYIIAHLDGNNNECLRHLKLAEKSSPTGRTIKYLLGLYSLRVNNPAASINYNRQLDFQSSYHGKTILDNWRRGIVCDALHLLQYYPEELNEAEDGLVYYPGWADFYLAAVRAYAAMGQEQGILKVIEACKTVSLQNGTVGDVMIEAALELRRHGNKEASLAYAFMAADWYLKQGGDFREETAIAYYNGEQWEKSRILFEQLSKEKPENYNYTGYLGSLAARRGDEDFARNIIASLLKLDWPHMRGRNTLWCARIAALLGDKDEAVELLRQSISEGRSFGPSLLQIVDFEPLKDFPAYKELVRPKN
jgi:TolB-like protein